MGRCENPLFVLWMEEWLMELVNKGVSRNYQYTVRRATEELKKYPGKLEVKEVVKLKGVGVKIGKYLEERWERYRREQEGNREGGREEVGIGEREKEGEVEVEREVVLSVDFTEVGSGQPRRGIPPPPKTKQRRTKGTTEVATEGTTVESRTRGEEVVSRKRRKPNNQKEFIPNYRSGGYAILLGLRELHLSNSNNTTAAFPKEVVIEAARPHCNVPMDKPLPHTRYTGWSSIEVLKKHDLVYVVARPARFALSETGRELSDRLVQAQLDEDPTVNPDPSNLSPITHLSPAPDTILPTFITPSSRPLTPTVISGPSPYPANHRNPPGLPTDSPSYPPPSTNRPTESPSYQSYELTSDRFWELNPGEFEVTLVLDNREVQSRDDRQYFHEQLLKRNVPTITRALSVGDALWIARPLAAGSTHEEIVLDYIIERKKMTDLIKSIQDGRFKEQKFRLRSCGAPKVIYLVEDLRARDAPRYGLNPQAIWTGLARTVAEEGFFLKLTTSFEDTLDYLARVTRQLSAQLKDHSVMGLNDPTLTRCQYASLQSSRRLPPDVRLTFATFDKLNAKSGHLTLHEVFLRMLLTCRNLSVAKALSLLQRYPTPASLLAAYRTAHPAQRPFLLAHPHPVPARRISNHLSRSLQLIWDPTLPSPSKDPPPPPSENSPLPPPQ